MRSDLFLQISLCWLSTPTIPILCCRSYITNLSLYGFKHPWLVLILKVILIIWPLACFLIDRDPPVFCLIRFFDVNFCLISCHVKYLASLIFLVNRDPWLLMATTWTICVYTAATDNQLLAAMNFMPTHSPQHNELSISTSQCRLCSNQVLLGESAKLH